MGELATPTAFSPADGGVVAPLGFTAAGVHCGLKPEGRRDLALVSAEEPVSAAALFTTNQVAAAPVLVSRRHIDSGTARAVVINAGNANACTGAQGEADARAMAHAVARALGCADEQVLVCSTGVIGVPLPVERVLEGIAEAAEALDSRDGADAAEAIRTTDTFAKQTAVSFEVGGRRFCAGGMAKGSGMIAPNMATMLSVITTDAPLTSRACDQVLRAACATSFNRLSIDSDTSTNDTVVLLASGAAGGRQIDVGSPDYDVVAEAVAIVCSELARMLARDGEGVTKLVTVTVRGALDDSDAEAAARSVADSPLVKTALFGNDANWGRVAMAVGKSAARVDQESLSIVFAGIEVCRSGAAVPFDEDAANSALDNDEVAIEIDLALGRGEATVLTCDLTYEYVRINGEYRS